MEATTATSYSVRLNARSIWVSVGSVIEVNPSSVEAPPTLVVVPSPEKAKRSRIAVEVGWRELHAVF